MRTLVYHLMRLQVRIAFSFYFRKLRIEGRENLPDRNTAVIFLPNHQNTFMDALCVAISTTRINHYMARGDIFGNPKVKNITSWVNLRPIYRIRDGLKAMGKNEAVFAELIYFLSKKQGVMLHPEGTHSLKYHLRTISKGFTRIAFGFMEKHPDQELKLVPVGLNYDRHTRYRSNVSIVFGPAIDARDYGNLESNGNANTMRKDVEAAMKELSLQIPQETYDQDYQKLRDIHADLSDFRNAQRALSMQKPPVAKDQWEARWYEKALFPLAFLCHWPAILLWKKLKGNFKDRAWHGPVKFAIGSFFSPLYLLIFTLTIAALSSWIWGVAFLLVAVAIAPVLRINQS